MATDANQDIETRLTVGKILQDLEPRQLWGSAVGSGNVNRGFFLGWGAISRRPGPARWGYSGLDSVLQDAGLASGSVVAVGTPGHTSDEKEHE